MASFFSTVANNGLKSDSTSTSNQQVDTLAWSQRVQRVHESSRPELMAEVRIKAERHSRAALGAGRAMQMQKTNLMSSMSSALALDSFSKSSSLHQQVPGEVARMYSIAQERNATIQSKLSKRAVQVAHENVSDDFDEEKELSSEMQAAFQLDLVGGVDETYAAVVREVDVLLKELQREPDNDAEIAAKFGMYESFLKTVETIREQTLGFWEENKELFTGASHASALKSIHDIDSEAALGVLDDPSKWFVFLMTKQVNANSGAIQRVLSQLQSRLELLSREASDCPFCLEPTPTDKEVTLGCCHKCCSDCWTHWVALKGNSAFCPLCKHQEFLSVIVEVAQT